MTPQNIFCTIIIIVLAEFLFEKILDRLNKSRWSSRLPDELTDTYSEEQFENHKKYRLVNYRYSALSTLFNLTVMLLFLTFGGFPFVDNIVRGISDSQIIRTILFFGIIGTASSVLTLPFPVYHTFVIEAKFGFNKTTVRTFIMDIIKSSILSIVIGVPIISLIVWFYESAGSLFWLYALIAVTAVVIFINMFYTSLILPLFNKLTPLPEGELREAISKYASESNLNLTGIYIMDGSQRSTKANAFFSGIGKHKKIVLFDTLINDLTTPEIVAVLAHEAGHYRLKHIRQGIVASVIQMAVTLYLLGMFVNTPAMSLAVGVSEPSFYIGITVFGILYTPISLIAGLLMNYVSRKNEFAADRFAAETSSGEALISGLKKISANSLSNPTPHPLYVFFNYSHPPLLRRIDALKTIKNQTNER